MKHLKFAAVVVLAMGLSGCSLIYPHWGATTFPTDSPAASTSAAPSSSASASASSSASASPSAKPVQAATLQILQANVDGTAGVIDVVAQVTNTAENGGQCTLTVTSGSVTKTQVVRAESNVDTTQCFPMEVSFAGMPKGSATYRVSYSSAGFAGSTSAQAVTIP
jgi:hypothetical protein